jgi:hypothetical protein
LWLIGMTVAIAAVALLLVSGAMGTVLSGSSFDTSNGSLTSGSNHDWNPAGKPAGNVGPVQPISCGTTFPSTGTNCALDWVGSSADNAFGQGTKEDSTSPTIVNGSIPPQKDDLSRFYINQESGSNGDNFLYLAWERTNLLGSAHMDFELNQANVGITNSSTGTVNLNRTAGDVLIDFDFGGSGPVTLSYHTWLVSGTDAGTQCASSNTFPCWSAATTLSPSVAIASVNSTNVNDYNPPVPAAGFNVLSGSTSNNGTVSSTFGEAGIDLQAAGIFPHNVCEHFGDAWLKSRSSGSSFSSEMKDFISPLPVNISNCGEVIIVKNTDPRNVDQDFSYTSTISDSGTGCLADSTPSSFTLNDGSGKVNTEDCKLVPAGNYTVLEGAEPTNFVLEGLSCTTNGLGSGSQDGLNPFQADITVVPLSKITCTYVNKLQEGAIKITKVSSKPAATPLAGATFAISGPNGYSNSVTTGSDGTVCVDHLSFGAYSVTETAAPAGYSIDDPSAHNVTISQNSTCGDGHEVSVLAKDTPLTDITATATSEAPGGTQSTITCVDSLNANVGNSPQGPAGSPAVAANGLKPGTYTCTIVVDP